MILPLLFLACQSGPGPSGGESKGPPSGTGDSAAPSDGALVASDMADLPEPDQPCDLDPAFPSDEFVSPSDGVTITTSPWIPVKMAFDEKEAWTEIRTFIDCVETTDPLAVQRRVPAFIGDGTDYLAYGEIAELDDGPHVISARLEDAIGHVEWQAARFSIERPPNRVHITVRNADGDKIDARIILLMNGVPYAVQAPDAASVDPQARDDEMHTILVPGGSTMVWLDTGDYEMIAARGPLQNVDVQAVKVDGDRDVSFVVDDAFDLTGTSKGDFHVHTASSGDSYLPQHVRVQSLLAAGLDLVSITDHEVIHDLEEEIDLVAGANARLVSVSGVEISMYMKPASATKKKDDEDPPVGDGHMNAFPLDPSTEYPPQIDNLGRFLDTLRESQMTLNPMKDGVLELNHPRGMQIEPTRAMEPQADLFNGLGFDDTQGFGEGANAWMAEEATDGVKGMDFDALEIMNRGSWPLYSQVRHDWFTLLGWGHRITGVGNSDSHAMTTEWAGFPTNVADCTRMGTDAASRNAFILCWIDAIRTGRIRVSTGPLVDLELSDGDTKREIGEMIRPNGKLTATVRVRAPAWVPVEEVRLVVDGTVLDTRALVAGDRSADGSLDLTLTWNVPTTGADRWVIAEAGWPLDQGYPADSKVLGTYALVVPEYLPLGFANPVFVDGDGDGVWAP